MGKFIDVSEFQKDIDWNTAKNYVDYAYARIGYRGSLAKTAPANYKKITFDKYWENNLKGMTENQIHFGVYFFPTAITAAEALEEAKWFFAQVKSLNMSLPPMLDSENVWGKDHEAGRANSLSKAERTRLLKIIFDYFEVNGMRCGIYASASWLNNKVDIPSFSDNVCVWVADSTGEVDYKGEYWLHQYGKGTVKGIGETDLNRLCGAIPSVWINKEPVTIEETKEDPVDVLLSIASAEVGYKEGANNWTKYGDEMHSIQPSNMDRYAAWCDCFVDWCVYKTCQHFGYSADTARKVLCGDFDDYTYFSVNLYKKASRWTQTPQRGAQIFFGGSGHTGLVEKVTGGKVYTIEGNKSNMVKRCSYSIGDSSIIGYGLPRFDLIGEVKETTTEEVYDMPTISRGSQGKAVKIIQIVLGGLDVDGSFGPATEAAVIAFQKKAFPNDPTEWDGVVGPKTWAKAFATL